MKILLSRDWWDLKVGHTDLSNASVSHDPPESMGTATHLSHERSLQATVSSHLSLSTNTRLVLWPLISSNEARGELWNWLYGFCRGYPSQLSYQVSHIHMPALSITAVLSCQGQEGVSGRGVWSVTTASIPPPQPILHPGSPLQLLGDSVSVLQEP